MTIYVLLVALIVFGKPTISVFSKRHQNIIYFILVGTAIALVMGLRSRYVGGVDTDLGYIPEFYEICGQSMSRVLSEHGAKDALFYVFTKLFTYISNDVVLYLLAISIFVSYSYSRFIYKYSENPMVSYLLFLALGMFNMGFQQLRQIIALSILLYAYDALKNRKFLSYCCIILIASMFHLSVIIFLFAYPLVKMKVGMKQWVVMFSVITLCITAKDLIFKVLLLVVDNTRFETYLTDEYERTLSLSGTIILMSIYLAASVLVKKEMKNTKEFQICANMSSIAVCFMALTIVLGEFQRLSKGFSAYNLILIPNILESYKVNGKHTKESLLFTYSISAILIVYFLFFSLEGTRMIAYDFFWND